MNKNVLGSVAGALIATVVTFGAIKYTSAPVADSVTPVTPAVVVVPVDPNAAHVVVAAPTAVRVGELAIIDVSASNADSFSWKVQPETNNFVVIDEGRRAVFSAESPGTYLFFIAAAKDGTVDSEIHTIQVGGGGPGPAPTVNLAAKVPQWIAKVQSPTKRDDALKLAQSFSSVAAMITPNMQPTAILDATVKSNRDALGGNIKHWEPFLIDLQAELEALAAAGALNDAEAHATQWRVISAALSDAAKAAPVNSTSVRGRR